MSDSLTDNINNDNIKEKEIRNNEKNDILIINKNITKILNQSNIDFEKIRQINDKYIEDINSLINQINEIITIIITKPYINKMENLLGKSNILLKGIENLILNNNDLENNFNLTQQNLYNLLDYNLNEDNNNSNEFINLKNELNKKDKQILNLKNIILQNIKEMNKFKLAYSEEKEQKEHFIKNSKSLINSLINNINQKEGNKLEKNQKEENSKSETNNTEEKNQNSTEKSTLKEVNKKELKKEEMENINNPENNNLQKIKEELEEKSKLIEEKKIIINQLNEQLEEKTKTIDQLNKKIELNTIHIKKNNQYFIRKTTKYSFHKERI